MSIQDLPSFQVVRVREEDTRTFDADVKDLIEKIKKAASEKTTSHEEILFQLGQAFLASRMNLEQYNIARRTLNAFIYNNKQVNGDMLRLIEAHIGLVIAYYLKKLRANWDADLAHQVRRVAVDNTLEIADPLDRDQISEATISALMLDKDPDLREALEDGLSYALPLDKVPVQALRLGIGIAFRSSINVVNCLKVLDGDLSGSVKETTESQIVGAIEKIEERLKRIWFIV